MPMSKMILDLSQVVVVATDRGTPRLSTEKTITVVVDDENDNSPDVVSLNSVLLLPGTPKGTTPTTIRAIDHDTSSNGIVTFKFAGEGNPTSRGILSLDQHTGQVAIPQNLLFFVTDVTNVSDDGAKSVRVCQWQVFNVSLIFEKKAGVYSSGAPCIANIRLT